MQYANKIFDVEEEIDVSLAPKSKIKIGTGNQLNNMFYQILMFLDCSIIIIIVKLSL